MLHEMAIKKTNKFRYSKEFKAEHHFDFKMCMTCIILYAANNKLMNVFINRTKSKILLDVFYKQR